MTFLILLFLLLVTFCKWIVLGMIVLVIGYGLLLGGAICFFVWQEKRPYEPHDRLRGEGF